MKPTEATAYRVNEIFYSLQGEGYFTGTPSVFIRMSGCNRACPFCDTDFASHTLMSAAEIVAEASRHEARHAVLTGGEPLLQLDAPLIDALHNAGFFIAIETNGSLPVPDGVDWVTCSPKARPWAITRCDELKAVYHDSVDLDEATSAISATHLFLQPCTDPATGTANTAETVSYILSHPWWRLSLQTHRLLGIR